MLRALPAIAFVAVWVIAPGQNKDAIASIYADDPSFWSFTKPSDYRLAVDGVSVPIIRVVPGPHPVSAVVMFDASSSVARPPVSNVARRLAENARPGDALRLGTFAKRILLSKPFDDRHVAADRAREVEQQGGPSPLWDALYASVDTVSKGTGVRAVLVWSDGMATGNDRAFTDVEELVSRSSVIVSVVGVEDEALYFPSQVRAVGRNDALRRLAQNSGGRFHALQRRADTPDGVLVAMAGHMRKRHRIDFAPPVRDGRIHEVRVTVGGRPVLAPTRLVF